MPIVLRIFVVLCFIGFHAFSTNPTLAAGSQTNASDALGRAVKAHDALEFEDSRRLARQALQLGGHSKDDVERLWYLVAVASAALDEPAQAKDAFSRVLLLNPDVAIDKGLSPKLKSPFMEAKGTAPRPLGAELTIDQATNGVRVRITDTQSWVHQAALRARVTPSTPFTRSVANISDNQAFFPLRGLKGYLQYSLVLLDEHQNELFALGSQTQPIELGRYSPLATRTAAQEASRRPPPQREATSATPYLVTGWTMLGLGVGAAAVGVPYHLRREARAKDWNSAACERPGAGTRNTQCGAIDRERARAQKYATVLYASGGGLALLGLVTLGLAPSDDDGEERTQQGEAQLACGFGYLALACDGRF